VIRSTAVAFALLFAACQPSAADHEQLGDRWYASGAYRDALAEYQLGLRAHPADASLEAKLGAAAAHVGDYATAVEAYIALGSADRSRAGEAADGLERTARAALAANDRGDAAKGLAGLRAVAPTRPLGRYARLAALDAADRGDTAGALALLPAAAATAGDPRVTDSLLYVYGTVAVRARACSTAVPLFEGVIRRQREPAVADGARAGLASCALLEGQRLLAAGKPADAEDWFRRASAPGAAADVVRGAFLGLGDVRLAQGDIAGALESYQQVLAGGTPGDTLTQQAQQKINALGKADAPSPSRPNQP
jgi:tetratricopeptide (TPR) repeat protein